MTGPAISVVVAVQNAQANLNAIIAALGPGLDRGLAEVLVCHAADDPVLLAPRPGLRLVPGRAAASIPELWRDGILAAGAETVATLSAHCVPADDWLEVACGLDLAAPGRAGLAGIGGLIVNDPGAKAPATAIHLLRYHAVATVQTPRAVHEIAADNALYRRSDILACADLLPQGFWEPAYHARFRARGLGLELHPALRATHLNRYAPREFMRQRRLHGRAFGLERAQGASPARRRLMLLASPAAFPVFAFKVTGAIWRNPALRRDWLRAAPWLYLFMANWCWGEMRGYADAATGRRR